MNVKLIAFDLDGTLTQHKQPLSDEHRAVLDALEKKYRLIMVGAGQVIRIFNQMRNYPIDIIGNYGMQYAQYDKSSQQLHIIRDEHIACDRASVEKRVVFLREKHHFTAYAGESVEYHPSGCVTFAILGTKALQSDKLAFDPDRTKRRLIYNEVVSLFPEYHVFIGGSSSFDMAPKPYDKSYALSLYCQEQQIARDEVVFVGDDYGPGGNDASVYEAGYEFIKIDDYRAFSAKMSELL